MEPKNWFVYDPESSFSIVEFATEKEAVQAAISAIKSYKDSSGWDYGVEDVIVGRITHRVKEVPLPTPEDAQNPKDYYCDFRLVEEK